MGVIVVGSVNLDRVVRVDALPAPGETVTARAVSEGFGGKGANQASAVARLGVAVRLVAAVGDDATGRLSLADLNSRGVDVRAVAVLGDRPTGRADVYVDRAGENFIVLQPNANAALTAEIVRAALAEGPVSSDDIMITGNEVSEAATAAAAQAAHSTGATLVHNLAPYRPLGPWADYGNVVLVANARESSQATGHEDLHEAARALADGRRAALVTVGGRGAVLAVGRTLRLLPPPTVEVVDTTGAGDAFCGALAVGLATGLDTVAAAERAVREGALAVTRVGARATPPDAGHPS